MPHDDKENRPVRFIRNDDSSNNRLLPPSKEDREAKRRDDEVRAREKELEKEQPEDEKFVTGEQVQAALNGLMGRISALLATKSELSSLAASINNVARSANANFLTEQQVRDIAKKAVPALLRNIDSVEQGTGEVMMLAPGGADGEDSVYFGTPIGFSVRGTKTLNYGIHAREYDSDGNLVDVGSETGGEDRTLKPTWDVARWI